MNNNLSELKFNEISKFDGLVTNRGLTLEHWNDLIYQKGNPSRFAKILEVEIMNDFEKAMEEQNKTMKEITLRWGENFKVLKTQVEEHKHIVKKSAGDIKDQVERPKQGMDAFNKTINDIKLKSIVQDIALLEETLKKLSVIEKVGLLEKLFELLKK
jgi:hypothetical protein